MLDMVVEEHLTWELGRIGARRDRWGAGEWCARVRCLAVLAQSNGKGFKVRGVALDSRLNRARTDLLVKMTCIVGPGGCQRSPSKLAWPDRRAPKVSPLLKFLVG